MKQLWAKTTLLFLGQSILGLAVWFLVPTSDERILLALTAAYLPVPVIFLPGLLYPMPYGDPMKFLCGLLVCVAPVFLFYLNTQFSNILAAVFLALVGIGTAEALACEALYRNVQESKRILMLVAFPFGIGFLAGALILFNRSRNHPTA